MAIVLPKLPGRRLSVRRGVVVRAEPAIGLRLLSLQQAIEPNEILEFEYCLRRVSCDKIDRLEISVMWCTEGKGSEDMGVHYFRSISASQLSTTPLGHPHQIETCLPAYPLSYEGRLIKIRWCIRLRLFLSDGHEVTTEKLFYLGHLTREI